MLLKQVWVFYLWQRDSDTHRVVMRSYCCSFGHTHTDVATSEYTNAHIVSTSQGAQIHQCICQENLRETMAFLGRCSATMGKILRAPSGDSSRESHRVSVGSVRLLWERELQRRSVLSSPHPADL